VIDLFQEVKIKNIIEVSKKILSGKIEHPFAIMIALSVAVEKDKLESIRDTGEAIAAQKAGKD
jgi:hypothetical protein